jgi:hypothetical protein
MTDDELKQLVASLAIDQKELTKQMAETDKELRAMFKETEAQFKRTDEKLERIGIHLGNVTRNQGDVAEEFFFHSLVNDTRLGSIHFDDVTKNMSKHRGKIQEEYDLVLTNGDAIAIIEVKYKAHQTDLDKLERKMRNFKALFPIYQHFKQYGAIASFHIHEDAKKEALERGYFVLQRRGELIHAENGEHLTVL